MRNEKLTFHLLAYTEFTRTTWNVEGHNLKRRINHASLGLMDECGEIAGAFKKQIGYNRELDKINLVEELGDFLYYLIRLCDEHGYCKDKRFVNQFENLANKPNNKVDKNSTMVDYCIFLNRSVYLVVSGKEHFDVGSHLLGTLQILNRFCLYLGTNLANIADKNIKKLTERHGATYNPDNLETRNKDKERKAMMDED